MSLSHKKKVEIIHQLNLDLDGNESTNFSCSKCGLLIATGYTRVVIGERGPYIEFEDFHIIKNNLFYPENQKHVYFHEYLSDCPHQIFVYHQRETVAYADYKIGKWYISPELVMLDSGKVCIDKEKSTVKQIRCIF